MEHLKTVGLSLPEAQDAAKLMGGDVENALFWHMDSMCSCAAVPSSAFGCLIHIMWFEWAGMLRMPLCGTWTVCALVLLFLHMLLVVPSTACVLSDAERCSCLVCGQGVLLARITCYLGASVAVCGCFCLQLFLFGPLTVHIFDPSCALLVYTLNMFVVYVYTAVQLRPALGT